MALNWKTRLLIIVIVGLAAINSVIFNQIMIEMPNSTNEKDPLFFEKPRYAAFYYDNGTLGISQESSLVISCTIINTTHSNVSITIGNKLQGFFYTDPNGIVYQNGTLKGNYSIWWVHVSNPMLGMFTGFGTQQGTIFKMVDPTGFMGPSWNNYTAVVDRKIVWWPTDQRLGAILGAQASFKISIYDSTKNKVATATLDLTCGILELWDGGINSRQTMTLYQTDYPISRNRLNIFPVLWIGGIILIAVSYIMMRINWKNKFLKRIHLNADKRNDTTLLMAAGLIAFGIEYVDIWFYLPLGIDGNLYLHLGYMGFLALICVLQRKRFVWLIPAFLEVAFVFAINFLVNDPYIPHLTAFMGSTISWLCLLWVSKHPDDWTEGKTRIGKILSKFI
ncbi:MAG: hypothetical protein ACTSPY_01340 [Candidatus Helarchaeota archaeon]